MSFRNAQNYSVVARLGESQDIIALLVGEISYDTDTKVFRVGDGSANPPRIMTHKSRGELAFNNLTTFKVAGVTISNGLVDGVKVSSLLRGGPGLIARTGPGIFTSAGVISSDNTILIGGAEGSTGIIDLRINFDQLPIASPGNPGLFAFPDNPNGSLYRDDGTWQLLSSFFGSDLERISNKGVANGYAGLNSAGNLTGYLKTDGSTPLTGNFNAGANQLLNFADPVDLQDGVPLDYFEDSFDSLPATTGRFRGVFASLVALTAAISSGVGGDWAIITQGSDPPAMAIWDTDNTTPAWILTLAASFDPGKYLPLSGGTMVGDVLISYATPKLILSSPTVSDRALRYYTNSILRWEWSVSGAESGSNAGSSLQLKRYTDAGDYIDTPISILRSTGKVTFAHVPTVNNIPLILAGSGVQNTDTVANMSRVRGATVTEALNNLALSLGNFIVMAPAVAPPATVGVAYSMARADNGGKTPFAYSLASGSLPGGLSLNTSSGLISGTPTVPGNFPFVLRRRDGFGLQKTLAYTISVNSVPLSATGFPPAGIVGTAYSYTLLTQGGVQPYSYAITSGALPAGLSLNPTTGVISGTPTTASSYTFAVRRSDALNSTLTVTYTTQIGVAGYPIGTILENHLFTYEYINQGSVPSSATVGPNGALVIGYATGWRLSTNPDTLDLPLYLSFRHPDINRDPRIQEGQVWAVYDAEPGQNPIRIIRTA